MNSQKFNAKRNNNITYYAIFKNDENSFQETIDNLFKKHIEKEIFFQEKN